MSSDALHFCEAVRDDARDRPKVVLSESTVRPISAGKDPMGETRSIADQEAKEGQLPLRSEGDVSDEFLFVQAANGSKEAIGLLFRRYRSVVRNVAWRILKDETEAEDLCQEVFVSLFQKAHLFDENKGTASSWIVLIAYHRAMNRRQYLAHRQHYNTQELDEEMISSGRQPLIVDQIFARDLLDCMRKELTDEQTQALELHFFEGYSLREIAEKTNQTLGSTRNRFYRGLERLRCLVFPQKGSRVRKLQTKSGSTRQPL